MASTRIRQIGHICIAHSFLFQIEHLNTRRDGGSSAAAHVKTEAQTDSQGANTKKQLVLFRKMWKPSLFTSLKSTQTLPVSQALIFPMTDQFPKTNRTHFHFMFFTYMPLQKKKRHFENCAFEILGHINYSTIFLDGCENRTIHCSFGVRMSEWTNPRKFLHFLVAWNGFRIRQMSLFSDTPTLCWHMNAPRTPCTRIFFFFFFLNNNHVLLPPPPGLEDTGFIAEVKRKTITYYGHNSLNYSSNQWSCPLELVNIIKIMLCC